MKKYLSLLFLIFFNAFLIAQEADTLTSSDIDKLPIKKTSYSPVVIGKINDGYPDSLKIIGLVNKVTISPSCGIFCVSGTVELLLKNKLLNYSHKNIFVIIPCLSGEKKDYLGKIISLEVYKYYGNEKECFYQSIFNNIDSMGIPFYYSKKFFNGEQ